ncbi:MAG TPA: hypothetical protein VM846_08065 [Vicinamibacterales bacterium]|jgi:hypothetical protein|nr:hypothetical protein [Vicinamibacterales bacterium]
MPRILQGWRLVAAVFAVSLLPALAGIDRASAQELRPGLRIPTTVASIAAAADWASTYHALSNYHVRETNPLLQPFQKSPGKLVIVGAAIDAASFTAWNKVIGPRHPRVAAGGMWAMAGFRAFLVLHNIRNEQKSLRR